MKTGPPRRFKPFAALAPHFPGHQSFRFRSPTTRLHPMSISTDRRSFLQWSAGAAAATVLGGLRPAAAWAAKAEPAYKISLAEWSLNRALFGHKLDHLDFAKTAKQD